MGATTIFGMRWRTFKRYFSYADAFGVRNRLYYEGEDKFRTGLGACITIAMGITVLVLTLTVIEAAFSQSSKEIAVNQVFLEDPGVLELTNENFNFAISLDRENHHFDRSLVGVRAQIIILKLENGNSETETTDLELKFCEVEDFAGQEAFFKLNHLERQLCPTSIGFNITANTNIDLQAQLRITYEKCDDEVHSQNSPIVCAPQEDIDEIFSTELLSTKIYFFSGDLNLESFEDPFQFQVRSLSEVINPETLSKDVQLYLKEYNLDSYQDFWQSELLKEWKSFKYDNDRDVQVFVPLESNKDEYLRYIFNKSNQQVNITRRYPSLGSLAAYIGGLWAILYRITKLIAEFINRIIYEKLLADELYHFEQGKEEKQKERIKKNKKNKEKLDGLQRINTKRDDDEGGEGGNTSNKVQDVNNKGSQKTSANSHNGDVAIDSSRPEYENSHRALLVRQEQNQKDQSNQKPSITSSQVDHVSSFKKKLRSMDTPKILTTTEDNQYVGSSQQIKEIDLSQMDQQNEDGISVSYNSSYISDEPSVSKPEGAPSNKTNLEQAQINKEQNKGGLLSKNAAVTALKLSKKMKLRRRESESEKKGATFSLKSILVKAVLIQKRAFKSLTYYFFLSIFFCCRTKRMKQKIIQQEEGIKLARKRLDVRYITRTLQEFEKLKFLLLDQKQRAIFNYLPAPTIRYCQEEEYEKLKEENEDKDGRIPVIQEEIDFKSEKELVFDYNNADQLAKLYEIYTELRLQGDPMNSKLIKMLGQRVRGLFKTVDLLTAKTPKRRLQDAEAQPPQAVGINRLQKKIQFFKNSKPGSSLRDLFAKNGSGGSINSPRINNLLSPGLSPLHSQQINFQHQLTPQRRSSKSVGNLAMISSVNEEPEGTQDFKEESKIGQKSPSSNNHSKSKTQKLTAPVHQVPKDNSSIEQDYEQEEPESLDSGERNVLDTVEGGDSMVLADLQRLNSYIGSPRRQDQFENHDAIEEMEKQCVTPKDIFLFSNEIGPKRSKESTGLAFGKASFATRAEEE